MKHWPARFEVPACWWLVSCVLTLTVTAQSPATQPGTEKEPTQKSEEAVVGTPAEDDSETEAEPVSNKPSQSDSTSAVEPTEPIIAIMGAQVHTMTDLGVIPEGVVLIQGSKILQVGDLETEIPEEAERIDAKGLSITPGLIDCRSRLWLTPAAANSSASDASLNVLDGVDGFSEDWREIVRQGITSVYVQPARQGTASGYGAVLSVAPGAVGPKVFAANAALQASLGVGARNNRSRSQQFERTQKLFAAAEEYQKKWDEYNAYLKKKAEAEQKKDDAGDASKKVNGADAAKSPPSGNRPAAGRRPVRGRGGPGGGPGGGPVGDRPGRAGRPGTGSPPVKSPAKPDGDDAADSDAEKADDGESKKEKEDEKKEPPKKPEKDPAKELLAKVVRGNIPLRLEIHTADDAHYALQLLDEFEDLQVVLEGLSDLGSATQSVVELGLPVVLGPWIESEPLLDGELTSCSDWGKTFADYAGTLSLATFGAQARSSHWLRAHLGRAAAHGFDGDRALRSVTVDAARLLGVSDQLGTLEVGKRADLVCFAGDPVDASTKVALVISGGQVVHREAVDVAADDVGEPVAGLTRIALPDRYAIKSERVLTPIGQLEPKLIIVKGDTIESLEAFETEPEDGLSVVDVGQAVVTPGLFSAHATFGIERLIDPDSQSDSTYVVAGDVFVGSIRGERERVESGLLRALFSPGNANPIAGTASLVRLGADGAAELRLAASKFVLTSQARDTDRFPSSLAGQVQLVKQSLAGTLLESRVYLPKPVLARLAARRAESFDTIQRGERLVLIAAETDAEIRSALDLIETQGLRAALLGPQQLEPFIDRIKALEATVIARPAEVADYHWYADDLAKTQQAGIRVYFAGENAEQLRLTAALAVSAGMERMAALSALFNGPQDLLNTKVLSEGVPADLIVWSNSPIHLGAKPLLVIVNGKAVEKHDE